MGVEFIFDEELHKKKKELNKVVKMVKRTPLNKKGLFLRRLFFACIKATEILDKRKVLTRPTTNIRMLPLPPSPRKQLIQIQHTLPPLPEPPSPIY